jgi:predicted TIM-barrel fold metal-dependent hydrolase
MQSPDLAIRELERCARELGLSGVEIGSNVNGANLDSPELFPIFEAAAALRAAVFVHPWEMAGGDRMTRYWLPWLVGMPAEVSLAICSLIFGGVLERLPALRIAFAHGGGAFPATIGRIVRGFEARPDLCAVSNDVSPREYLRRIYLDSLVHDPLMLRYLVDLMGPDRIALGSDYPFPLGEARPGELIDSCGFPEETRGRLLHGTALEWLDLPAARFAKDSDSRERAPVPARRDFAVAWIEATRSGGSETNSTFQRAKTARKKSISPAISLGSSPKRAPKVRRRGAGEVEAARRQGAFLGGEPMDALPRASRGADGEAGGRLGIHERSRDDELAHRQPSPDDGELLPAHPRAASDPPRGSCVPLGRLCGRVSGHRPRLRPGRSARAAAARRTKGKALDRYRGRRPGPRTRG